MTIADCHLGEGLPQITLRCDRLELNRVTGDFSLVLGNWDGQVLEFDNCSGFTDETICALLARIEGGLIGDLCEFIITDCLRFSPSVLMEFSKAAAKRFWRCGRTGLATGVEKYSGSSMAGSKV